MMKVAILGTGAMGSRVGINLLAAGFDLRVWNRTPARYRHLLDLGAIACATPREASAGAEVVMSMLTDDEAAREVWLDSPDAAVNDLDAAKIALECSSVTPGWSRELAAAAARKSAVYLEAPMIGSRPQADARQLIHLVGGDSAALERVRPVLRASAGTIRHVGPVGSAMAAKLAVNTLFAAQVALLGEILGVMARCGIAIDAALDLLADLPTTSPALGGIGALLAARDFEPLFPIGLVAKDLGYFDELAAGVEAPLAAGTRDVFERACRAGYGERNIAAVTCLYL